MDRLPLPTRRSALLIGAAAFGASWPALGDSPSAIEKSRDRVVTNLSVPWPWLGTVRARRTDQIESSNWLIGCETLDRDFADYDQYKEYIAPLGIKRLRMQAGWAKTEKRKGVYDFAWLDHIVRDATKRGFKPWLQTSYGNPIYPQGGGDNLGAGLPVSEEALSAYDRWVSALVTRYKDDVSDWEVWNEPNFGDNTLNTPEATAEFNARTVKAIIGVQPQAKVSALALGHYQREFVERFFSRLAKLGAVDLFDNVTYHDYAYNPDSNEIAVAALRTEVAKYSKKLRLRQGENGAPSAGGSGRGALWDYDWTELSQAKWNTRRMLGNLGNDIECCIFSLVEMNYNTGPIHKMNYKGILKSDVTKRVVRPKVAYYAMQNVTALFDNTLERIRDLENTHNIAAAKPDEHRYSYSTDRRVAFYGYRHKTTRKQTYTLWFSDNIPDNEVRIRLLDIRLTGAEFEEPVWVDIITGAVHAIPKEQWSRAGAVTTFKAVPVYDAPVVITDRSLVNLGK